MRELTGEEAKLMSPEQIMRFGLNSMATTAPGGPTNPCYGEKRKYKDYAVRILELAEARDGSSTSDDEAARSAPAIVMECTTCFALTWDLVEHEAWHESVARRAAFDVGGLAS